MKPDTLLDALNYVDDDLLAWAEEPGTKKIRRLPRRLIALAACLTLLLGATAFATGALDPLLAYFDDPSGLYLEGFLAAGDSVANDTMEIRVEGAIADSRTAYLVVSFLGLDEATARDLRRGGLDVRPELVYTVVTPEGKELPFSTTTMGTYTTGKSQAISHFEDADLTYVFAGTLPENCSMEDMDQVCLTYEGLSLSLPVGDYLCPEYALEPEGEGLPAVSHLRMSAIGFSYTTTEEELYLDLLPIYADGTVYESFREDYGTSAGGDGHSVTGHWCAGSPLALAVLDLNDYCGLQVNGVNYYFVED
ncbi:MAG: hypothetical protein IJE03_05205 [Ruminiclostridium sp.]|nr:hypothetical protein [Ruminiclostridium sp.]MBQ9932282.1 hypothetical protein [Ruminiclostridium sp.]